MAADDDGIGQDRAPWNPREARSFVVLAKTLFAQMFESSGMLYPTAAVERLAVDMRIGTVKGGCDDDTHMHRG